jgi:L-threonylcarbamoyladenylate synthase
MKKYWPGPLTILFPTSTLISKALTTNTGKIGIRISSHPVAQAITQQLGKPLTTTSANLTGFPPSYEHKHIQNYFGEKLDLIVDAGTLYSSRGSTVVDVSEDKLVVIREGDISADDIFELFRDDVSDD